MEAVLHKLVLEIWKEEVPRILLHRDHSMRTGKNKLHHQLQGSQYNLIHQRTPKESEIKREMRSRKSRSVSASDQRLAWRRSSGGLPMSWLPETTLLCSELKFLKWKLSWIKSILQPLINNFYSFFRKRFKVSKTSVLGRRIVLWGVLRSECSSLVRSSSKKVTLHHNALPLSFERAIASYFQGSTLTMSSSTRKSRSLESRNDQKMALQMPWGWMISADQDICLIQPIVFSSASKVNITGWVRTSWSCTAVSLCTIAQLQSAK